MIESFQGLFNRGSDDVVPKDHGINVLNCAFGKAKDFSTRPGTALSLTRGSVIVRQFDVIFDFASFLLTCDGAGHIYKDNSGTPLLTITNMIDFSVITLFNKCLLAPILSSFSANNPVYVWDGINAPRPAAGLAPTASFSAAEGGAGNVDVGLHSYAVCYI